MNQFIFTPEIFQNAMDEGTKFVASAFEVAVKQILLAYWQYILIFIMIIGLVKILTGRIGSLIYNIIYFGILFGIIAIKGFEILFDPLFDIIYALLYPVSFYLTGRILEKISPRYYDYKKYN